MKAVASGPDGVWGPSVPTILTSPGIAATQSVVIPRSFLPIVILKNPPSPQ